MCLFEFLKAQFATDNVDFYNILLHNQDDPGATAASSARIQNQSMLFRSGYRHFVQRLQSQSLSDLMNGPIRAKLGATIPAQVSWGAQSQQVFSALYTDFMQVLCMHPGVLLLVVLHRLILAVVQDVVAGVDSLLARGFPVTVYSGQLDLICATSGTEAWMNKCALCCLVPRCHSKT